MRLKIVIRLKKFPRFSRRFSRRFLRNRLVIDENARPNQPFI